MLSFQQIILALQQFWADKGCVVLQPYDMEMGAGTFHPATVLRSLGPKPWNAAFVQPSRRPTDSRYGQNPNRLQHYYQFQVLLKPSPDNIQELYLESLARLGIDAKYDDLRFVEDDWASPTLGASGLGWEVWCNGMEVSQFTYMQQIAGIECSPVVGELTYGLERLALYIQGKDNVWDLDWNGAGITYKDVAFDPEVQFSGFNLERADVQVMLKQFEEAETECLKLVEANLPFPAYDFCIKASHLFNLMSARGVISVVERASYIAKVRALSKACVVGWMEMQESSSQASEAMTCDPDQLSIEAIKFNKDSIATSPDASGNDAGDLLLELYTEEIPAMMQKAAETSYTNIFTKHLTSAGIKHEALKVYVGPRRITLHVASIDSAIKGQSLELKGPKVGAPDMAIDGFCKSNNITREQLVIKNIKDQDCYVYESEIPDKPTARVLPEVLRAAIAEYVWPKSMRWGSHKATWVRPLKNIVCLFGGEVLQFAYEHLLANNKTYGHRFMAYHEIEVSSFEQYKKALSDNFVVLDREERKEMISEGLVSLGLDPMASGDSRDSRIKPEEEKGAVMNEALLEEVTGLVEYPVVLKGKIPERFMKVPSEVLVAAMEKHQRYFAMYNSDGSFAPSFLFVSNIKTDDPANIIAGNERVLSARLSDALFFYENGKREFAEADNKLSEVMFHSKLGSMKDKVRRVEKLCEWLLVSLRLDPRTSVDKGRKTLGSSTRETELLQAARFCKNDLVTEIVDEFPELQGIIGGYYAASDAIRDHYKPMGSDDTAPSGDAALLALADKTDSLVSLMAAGERATGSGDPYALRRYALGIIRILLENDLRINLKELIDSSLQGEALGNKEAIQKNHSKDWVASPTTCNDVLIFIEDRLKHYLRAQGYDIKLINAVIDFDLESDVAASVINLKELDIFLKTKNGNDLLAAYRRASGILGKTNPGQVNQSKFTEEAEMELFEATNLNCEHSEAIQQNLKNLSSLLLPINNFFDNVMVKDKDLAVADNRLALLRLVVDEFDKVAKFGELL